MSLDNPNVVYKSYKTELDPNNKQKTLFKKNCGVARFAYNWGLATLEEDYKNEKKLKPNFIQLNNLFNSIKKEKYPWALEASKWSPAFALQNLSETFKKFFNKQGGFPKYKKKGHKDSFTVFEGIKVVKNKIKIPKIGWVKLKQDAYIPQEKPKAASISLKAGRWFVSVRYEHEITQGTWTEETIGVDLGIKSLAICSDGEIFEAPRKLKKKEKKLKRLQRKMATQKKGSNSRNKTKQKLAVQHYKIANERKDILHKATSTLVKTKPQKTIVIEDLNVSGMVKNHKLAKAISNIGFYEFRRQLEYKCKWYGKVLVVADRFYPSSKLCSGCKNKRTDLKLSHRTYKCPKCGLKLDRDLNAAINLSKYTAEYAGINAGGDDKVHVGRKKSTGGRQRNQNQTKTPERGL